MLNERIRELIQQYHATEHENYLELARALFEPLARDIAFSDVEHNVDLIMDDWPITWQHVEYAIRQFQAKT